MTHEAQISIRPGHIARHTPRGALAVPTPTARQLSDNVRRSFAFLADLDADEQALARSDPRDRSLAIRLLEELPGGRLAGIGLY